jgi:DNA-binding Lrp family transcriptional regulator
MLGSAADAEDVLQESWLRWADVDQAYVGEWLPEPLLTSPDVAEDVELAESVSIAMLTVLETLGPTERAVFVLREVFALPYGEIAEATGKSAATVRQVARRAREHVAARRPRVQVSRSEQQAVVERFLAALRTGQLQELLEVMAPDVVMIADGGGQVVAALTPIHGVETVAKLLAREPGGGRLRDDDRLAQRRARGPDRDRRRTGRGEPRGGEREDHPDLRDAKPAETDAAGRTVGTREVGLLRGRPDTRRRRPALHAA